MRYIFFSLFILQILSVQGQTGDLLKFKLDSILANYKDNEPGGSVLIKQGSNTLYSHSFGLADIQTKERFTSKTISNVGSITKTFVGYGILLLQDQGKLSIEDDLLKYFPDFKNKDIARKVKIRHLLTHTSGLPDSRNVDNDSIFYLTAKDEENFAPLKKTDTLEFEPGSKWKYSNPAFNGLALIIEKVSGMKWQEFIRKNIFLPSAMKDSKITDGAYPQKGVAHGYRFVGGHYEEYDFGEYPTFCAAGNGGVWSSVEELANYADAISRCSFADCKTISFSETVWQPANWKSSQPSTQAFSWVVTEPKQKSAYRISVKIMDYSVKNSPLND